MKINYSFLIILSILIYFYGLNSLLIALTACFLHELGHIIGLSVFRLKIERLTLSSVGFQIISTDLRYANPIKQLTVFLLGPILNLILAFYFNFYALNGFRSYAFFNFSITNLFLFYFNILPIKRLDGGQILRILLSFFVKNLFLLERILTCISITTLLILLAFGVYFSIDKNYSLLIISTLLLLTENN